MDALAAGGVRFANAFVTTPICAASRASIFTGLYERTHGYTFTRPPVASEAIAASYPALLRRAGYSTGFVGKFGIAVADGCEESMFDFYEPSRYPYMKKVNGEERHLTDINIDRAIDFLRSRHKNRPFCLSVSFNAPHAEDSNPEQYVWPRSCDSLYNDTLFPAPPASDRSFFDALPGFLRESMNRERWHWRFDTPEKRGKMVRGYYRMISGIDMALGRLRREVRRLGMEQDTVFVLIGDNGYFLGERGYAGKWSMHDLSIRVPLIVCDPRSPASARGTVRDEMVLNVDIAPTLLDLAGLAAPGTMQGRSLLPLLGRPATNWRSEILCEHLWDHPKIPRTEGLRTKRWKYIRYLDHPGFEELYDVARDPGEELNLSKEAASAERLAALRERCDAAIAALPVKEG